MGFKDLQATQLEPFQQLISVEDHLIDGGFGSWMLESITTRPDLIARIKVKALNYQVCGMVGKQSTLNQQGGLNMEMLCG
jgi:transketolase